MYGPPPAPPTGGPPHWVRDLDDYWTWLEEVIEAAPGYLAEGHLAIDTSADPDEPRVLWVHRSHFVFYDDGSCLTFELIVGRDLEALTYNYDYRDASGALIGRLDKHPGEDWLTHLHTGVNEDSTYADEFSLEEAIERLRALR